MPKTSILWILIYSSGLIASFVNPLFGALTYLFEYYLRPSLHWWGDYLPDLRWNLIVSLVLGATYLMHRAERKGLGPVPPWPARFLIGLGVVMVLVSPFALDSTRSWQDSLEYLKMMVFGLLIVGTVKTEAGFDGFVAANIAGAGWWGWGAFRDPAREAGRLVSIGSGDTYSDNLAAAHLLTVLPFILVYLLCHKDRRLRLLALVTAPFVINAFILCNSRGAVVALAVGLTASLLLVSARHRVRMVATGMATVVAFYVLADPEFISRQQTTMAYEDDSSATGRLRSWQGGLELIKDYPLGAGGKGYQALSPVYTPDVVAAHDGQIRSPHNTFILVAADWGIQGLVLFLGYYGSLFLLLRRVRKRDPGGGIWYYRSVALHVCLISLLVAGFFSDRLYAEAVYWMGGLTVALYRIQARTLGKIEATQ